MTTGPIEESADADLGLATAELRVALDALRRAQSFWPGTRPWTGKTWDVAQAARAIDEAEAAVRRASERLERARKAHLEGARLAAKD